MSGPAQRLGVSANWPCTLVVQYGVGSPIDTGSPISTGLPTTGPGATDIELYKAFAGRSRLSAILSACATGTLPDLEMIFVRGLENGKARDTCTEIKI